MKDIQFIFQHEGTTENTEKKGMSREGVSMLRSFHHSVKITLYHFRIQLWQFYSEGGYIGENMVGCVQYFVTVAPLFVTVAHYSGKIKIKDRDTEIKATATLCTNIFWVWPIFWVTGTGAYDT